MDISDLHDTFFEETDELLADMEQHLIEIDVDNPDSEELNAIFRAAHSIKGGAGAFGFTLLQNTTHRLENLLDDVRHGEIPLDKHMVDVFLETRDMLQDQVNDYREQREPDAEAYERICKTLQEIAEHHGVVDNDAPAVEAVVPQEEPKAEQTAAGEDELVTVTIANIQEKDVEPIAGELGLFGEVKNKVAEDGNLAVSLATSVNNDDIEAVLCFIVDADQIDIQRSPLDTETAKTVAEEVPAEEQPKAESPAASKPAEQPKKDKAAARKPAKKKESSSLRVSTEKVDQIINLVGELVITQSMLEQTTSHLEPEVYGKLSESMSQLQRNARDLQEAVMSVRMIPMDYAFNRFPRLVRDVSAKLGKKIKLETKGASTELDKGLIEKILDPMMHLVRNSLDHGIETPDVREKAGKPREGTLTLAAQHQGGNILIEIIDDGAGLNREKILAKAEESGLPVSDEMKDADVWKLIFEPGFSTADEVTDVSGRGVGMDVVKRNIQQLGGHVDIRSEKDKGTAICIALPLTLAIMDGMSVQVGDEVFILPLGAIMESMQVRKEQINRVTGNECVLHVRGEYLSLVELHDVFDVPGAETDLEKGIIVVLQAEGRQFALLVDRLLGQHQVVVKNLEANYRKVDGISAATILGDGSVALILDVVSLSRSSRRTKRNSRATDVEHNSHEAIV